MRVVFRADSSFTMATGHVVRSLALAGELRRRNADVTFVSRDLPGNAAFLIEEQGITLHRLPRPETPIGGPNDGPPHAAWLEEHWSTDVEQTLAALEGTGDPDWVVVDHYALDARWESRLRARAPRSLVIDDLADRRHDADVLVDQNVAPTGEDPYVRLLPAGASLLRGPAYALVRPEFARLRESREPSRQVRRVLVFMGGADSPGVTSRALDALSDLTDVEVDVVVGSSNPIAVLIRERVASLPNGTFHFQVGGMAELMLRSDLAVGAGGGAAWERCCLGLPSLVVTLERNQVRVAETLECEGAARYLGHHDRVSADDIAVALHRAMGDPDALASMSRAGMSLVDGKGVSRVADAMESQTSPSR